MKRSLVLIMGILVLGLFSFPQMGHCAPKAVAVHPVFDAGEIPQGKELTNEFLLKNAGNEPLTFKVRPC